MKNPLDTFRRVAATRRVLYAVVLAAALAPTALLAQITGTAPTAPKILLVETLGNTATLNWTPPTQYADSSPIGTAVLSYSIYAAAPGTPWKPVASSAARTWTSAPLTLSGPMCYMVTAHVLGLESVASGAVCEQVGPPSAPNAPAALTLS